MATFRPFASIRPRPFLAEKVAALPYDVMNSEEARKAAEGNPYSFLHVDKAEIDLPPDTDLYDDSVYEKAASNLQQMITDGVYVREEKPVYYIYRLLMGEKSQAGIVGCASIDEYMDGTIKKHELTVAAKEADRIRHVDTCNANTGPIFLTFRENGRITELLSRIMKEEPCLYDFTSEDGIRHSVWQIGGTEDIDTVEKAFQEVPCFYIADGHHRAASAVRVGMKRREENPSFTGSEEFNFFLSVAFPSTELSIWDYNRVVKDLNGLSLEAFMEKIRASFTVRELPLPSGRTEKELAEVKPSERHSISMYTGGRWYELRPHAVPSGKEDVVEGLDVSVLQNRLLSPVLGICDPRTDSRIQFVGGIRGLSELVRLVEEGAAAAFALYPTSMEELMEIADQGRIMPPKSTWFEPKLRSGLFIHSLS